MDTNVTATANKKTKEELIPLYERLRAQIEHEDDLVNQRLTWLLVLQGFLFVTYGTLLHKDVQVIRDRTFVICVIGCFGAISSIFTLNIIMQAFESLRELSRTWREATTGYTLKELESMGIPQIKWTDRSLRGFFGTSGMLPLLLTLTWTLLVCTKLYNEPAIVIVIAPDLWHQWVVLLMFVFVAGIVVRYFKQLRKIHKKELNANDTPDNSIVPASQATSTPDQQSIPQQTTQEQKP